jgi:hypothetical protein
VGGESYTPVGLGFDLDKFSDEDVRPGHSRPRPRGPSRW